MIFKNIFQIYTLLICFVCTVILIIDSGFILNSVVNLLIPQYANYSSLVHYESNDNFLRKNNSLGHAYEELIKVDKAKELAKLSPAQLDEERLAEKKEFLEKMKGKSIESLISYLQWVCVVIIFFLIHWRLYKRSKEKE